jgi:hypothetical protein
MGWRDDEDQADIEEERSTWDPYDNDNRDNYPEPSEDNPDPSDNDPDGIGYDGWDD